MKREKKITKEERKEVKKRERIRRCTQNAIKYDVMLKDGTCVYNNNNLFSQTIEFSDANYVTENDEERQGIFNTYMGLLNAMSNPVDFNLTVVNTPISEKEFHEKVFMCEKDDGLEELRDEWNKSIHKKIMEDSSRIITKRYFTYSVKEDNLKKARNSLAIISRELKNKLQRDLQVDTHLLDGYERLELLHKIYKPNDEFVFDYNQINPSFTTKDAIAPDLLDFKEHNNSFRADSRYCKVFYLKNWSTEIFDELIYRLSKLEFNQVISIHMRAIERGEDISLVKTQIANMEMEKIRFQKKALEKGYDPEMLPLEFQYAYDEAKELLQDIQQRNQRLFDCQFLLMLNADTKEQLDLQEADVQAIFKEVGCVLGELINEQEDGMNACLPIGNMYSGKTRLLTTSATSAFIPFISKEIFDDRGFYYGVNNTTGNMLFINRTALANPGGWEFGTPGSGKSYGAKREIHQTILGTNDDVIIIDPENEYGEFVKAHGGEVVDISLTGKERINPWGGNPKNEDFMSKKVQFAQSYSATIMGGDGLDVKEKSIVDRVARKMYTNYSSRFAKDGDKALPPTGLEYYNLLMEQPEEEAKNLAISHELYSVGSYNIFAEQSNIDDSNRIMCYSIMNLDEVMRPLGMMVILESIWNRIVENRKKGKHTWIWVDEIYLLFKYDYTAEFFYELYKRARKYGGIVTGITQNVSDLLQNDKATTMLSNAQFILIFNQSQSDAEELAELLNISDAQIEHVLRASPGSGIVKVSNDIITFEDEADKKSKLYKMATTKFSEVHNI